MRKAISLDANLLVLLIVGLAGPKFISKHKRLQTYDAEDFNLLKHAISESSGLVVTPNTLSEASNLLRQGREPMKTLINDVFRNFINSTKEIYIKSANASSRSEFARLGLSDGALLEIAKGDIVVLSADLDLCVAAEVAGYAAINFNHVRDAYSHVP